MDLQTLQTLFPRSGANCSTTGPIPMTYFFAHEREIAKVVKENNLRRIYRGPRSSPHATMTLKDDAETVLLYRI